MHFNKDKTAFFIVITIAWLIALSLAYIAFLKLIFYSITK